MIKCEEIDALVTPYVDGELAGDARARVEHHLHACVPCRARVAAEESVCQLVRRHKAELCQTVAPPTLRARLEQPAPPRVVPFPLVRDAAPAREAHHAREAREAREVRQPAGARGIGETDEARRATADAPPAAPALPVRRRIGYRRLAIAALVLLAVGSAMTYRVTVGATRAMAAELTADHMKCFMVNSVLHTHESVGEIETYMRSGFDWAAQLPRAEAATQEHLEAVGSRPCFYEHGKVAHIMYHHKGLPVSIFMLPGIEYQRELVHTMGHDAVVWAAAGRTFVLIANAPRADVERIAAFVQTSLR